MVRKSRANAVIPWEELRGELEEWRTLGYSWQVVTDSVNAKFGTSLSVQAVRYRVGTEPQRSGTRPTGSLVAPAYVLPAVKDTEQRFDDDAFFEALARVADARGKRRSGEPLTLREYDEYRKDLAERKSRLLRRFPSSVAVRRRFGTWNAALEAAGVATNAPKRSYDGLGADDAVVHVAHWLRWLRRNDPGVTATVSRYRLWAKERVTVPSAETLRRFGPWAPLVHAAADLERSPDDLPRAKPVGKSGPGKAPLTLLPLGG